ncbi:tetratricopeptide repeat protein [Dyadobacter fermentans]|uniref:TPR repeat-containing protein n=1 Tax=Dyadobacter fermentans (strain ATCC 700827 / DSM 18053 / CIP 107007 / KCTC 52180 / NS114) TaxID=471854 RepID=C6W3J3_DYAFD|nr:tetratricopeptide repeat protein [Dyadobacter fermentans]ACT93970.1 TPR repeat-containing protein [Dyadobacter fermentans DSM 18053]
MVQKIRLLVLTGMLLMLKALSPQPLSAQDFSECQRIVKELLPTFNKSFEDNNPALLRDEKYQRGIRNLQAAYALYHKQAFQSSDSAQRMNNEAVILALSGNYQKALHIMEALDFGESDQQMHYNRGLFALLSGKFDAARNDFGQSPGSSEAKLNTLVALARQKKFQEAEQFASDNSAKSTGGKWNFNIGMVHKYGGRMEEAVAEITTAIRQKDEMAYRLQRGDILMRTGNEKRAVKDFEKVARTHPKAQIRYANALLSLNQFGMAKAVFEKYLETDDRTFRGDAYLGMAHSSYGLQQTGEAQRYYKLASTLKRETPALQSGIANTHLSKHEYQTAFNLFDRVIKKDSTYLPAYLGRAVAYYGQKKYDLALRDFKKGEKALNEDNKFFADLFVTKAFSEYYLKQTSQAQEDFQKAIKLDPARYEALAGLSGIMIDSKRYSEAGQYLARALQYEQGYDLMWSNYGNLLLHFDMYKKGYQVFKKAVSLNPSNVNAQNGWGIALLENDQLDKSMAVFDSLVREKPELPFLHNNHGIVQAYIGNRHDQKHQVNEANTRYDGAFEDFKLAMDAAPGRKFYNVNQGNVYRYMERYDDAKLSYQSYQDKSALNNTAVMYAGQERLKDAKYYLGVALQIDSLHRVFQYNMSVLVKGKQKEMMRLVASSDENSPFSDIGIKYSRDGFVTIYLYDYEYDVLTFPGRHYMPLPVAEYKEDYFIPEYDFKLVPYEKKKVPAVKKKRVRYHSQKVRMPGSRGRSGTKCPILF